MRALRAITARSWVPAALWTFYVIVPVAGWGILAGRPVGPIGGAVLVAVWWGWLFGRRAPLPGVVAALIALKVLASGPFLVEHGFVAWYYANDAWRGPHERSIDFIRLPATRIDREIDFTGHGFPLYFFNDNRFNYLGPEAPQRTRLAFSVRWRGWLHAAAARQPTVSLTRRFRTVPAETPGAAARLAVDGETRLTLDPDRDHVEAAVTLTPGWHRIDIDYRTPYGGDRTFAAAAVDGRDRIAALGPEVRPAPVSPWRLVADRATRWVSWVIDLAVLLYLAAWVGAVVVGHCRRLARWRRHGEPSPRVNALALAALLVAAFYWVQARPLAGLMLVLGAGHDWLTYEMFARDIALNGPLMRVQAAAFYYQPLYPYFMALTGLVFGEGFWGLYFCQHLLFAVTVWALYALTARLFGAAAGWVAAALGVYFRLIMSLNTTAAAPSASFLSESLFVPLLAFWALALLHLPEAGGGRARPALTGVLGGLAVLTRSTLLLALPFVLAIVAWTWRRRVPDRWARGFAVFALCLAATIGLATMRNLLVAGEFVVVASSGPINLLISNEPPPGVDVSAAEQRPLYRRLGVPPQTAKVIEYAWQAPGAFASRLLVKLRYTLGLTKTGREAEFFVLVWVTALIGIGLCQRRPRPGGDPLRFLPATLAACHWIVLIVVGVFTYGYRLVYPMYLMLIPYSALTLVWLANRVGLSRHDRVNVL